MRFDIEYSPEAREDLRNLPKEIQQLVNRAILERLQTEPLSYGKPLRYSYQGIRSLRVSKYRVLYKVVIEGHIVKIIKIEIRRDVYE